MPNWVDSPTARPEFFAGWLTEYALSVDNIFVFVIILARLRIDSKKQQLVLLLGIIIALLLRGAFIAAGAAIISRFQSVFFIFGAFLIFTAIQLVRESGHEEEVKESRVETYLKSKGTSTFTIALISLGVTDLVFALDSIPAIFAVTDVPFLVFASNALAILGLRSMYFLIANLMEKFVYLKEGLSVILLWVGIKMIVGHAFIKIPTALSLGVIVAVLTVAIVASIKKVRASEVH